MDLIYTAKNRIEQGVLQNFAVDFDTTNNKDFQITVGIKNNVLQGGFYWYIEGTEYGGKVDGYEVLTETNEIRYTGRNFRGILESKVIEPPTGQDYKIVSGNLQDVVSGLIAEKSLQDIFAVDASDVVVSNHKINRYVTLYEGISAIATRYGLMPSFVVKDGKVHVSFRQPIDYSDANEYTQDDLNFSIKRSFADVNHLICLGQGELKDRTVVHLYADAEGNVSETQSLFGIDEVVAVYENTNAEDANILKTEGIEKLNELKNTDSFEVTIPDIDLQIGDIIGGIERVTNTYVARQIVNVIAKITDTRIDLEYKVGEDSSKRKTTSQSSGNSSSSSGGGGGSFDLSPATKTTLGGVIIGDNINVDASGRISVDVQKITVDSELSSTSENPVQNKVIAVKLDEVFQSVSDGKDIIASAITDKGVSTNKDATFEQMAENIRKLSGGLPFMVMYHTGLSNMIKFSPYFIVEGGS